MRRLISVLTFFAAAATVILLWAGCSETPTDNSAIADTTPDISSYFPLNPGSSLQYMETSNVFGQTSYYRCTIGEGVNVGGYTVYEWTRQNVHYPLSVDTGYLFSENDGLYYFESSNTIPEKLLESPLEVGNSWLRFDPSQNLLDADDIIAITTESNNIKPADDAQDSLPSGGQITKTYPTIGSNYFEISAIEDIDLDNGNTFEDCLKVENQINDASNYYWYARGVGLVRYVVGVDPDNYPNGELVGEIVMTR
ncbi:MAG: hypothetical protein JSU69_09040 [Candidatus Zixiibacteriota bacterium]|nr:MAG: hypothetical protein JSU69_09040 [candidate division Zixibacteria bacterium]